MKKILVDSAVVVDFLRVKNRDSTLLQSLANQKYKLFISIITHVELYAGKSIWQSKVARKELELILSGLEILKLEEKTSKKAGELRAHYDIGIADAIVAATAISNKLTLATLNVKDFQKIKDLKLFR